MGQRSGTESAIAIIQAFLVRRSWRQSELADRVGIRVPALRKRLAELETLGFPLRSKRQHPDVWWSLPKDWLPGSVMFAAADVPSLVRQLARGRRSAERDRLLRRVLEAAPRGVAAPDLAAMVPPSGSAEEDAYLSLIEDVALRQTLYFQYFTASRIDVAWRHASVQRVVTGPPARFLAVCHRDGKLKWFRVDAVLAARADTTVRFKKTDPAEVDRLLAESLDGFHAGDAVPCAFHVRDPEARWVMKNLPGPMDIERDPRGGVRITTTTAGILRLARFVVGLGAAARAETPELARLVEELALGARGRRMRSPATRRSRESDAKALNETE